MEHTVTGTGPTPATAPTRVTGQRRWWVLSYLMRDKVGTAGLLLFAFFVLMAIFGPIVTASNAPTDVTKIYGGPTLDNPLGTDYAGRDVLVQIVRGGRSILIVGALAALISTAIAVTFGALAAYVGGWFDSAVLGLTDIVLTIPYIILLGVLAAYITLDSPYLLALIIAVVAWPTLLRAVRAQVLSLKEREYVEAAQMLDLGTRHVLFREILPNMANYILINFVIAMTSAVYGQIILYFLGLVPLPRAGAADRG
jgi:peptide/nickel transport system permease protein